ncbi:hypothetical protein BD410DRAFT_813794 [Rickenella mellea]|uniref:Nudix hydrolase domain-containing protein n=1 Tax=Rickenella mellea TaxID=50990 RepID=A0A4Y7QB80_9AGAM|nr:hypothetical protein BD410DRAFT_813794 [Rickenella mellea]
MAAGEVKKSPNDIRLSSSLVVVNAKNEVLLVHRSPDSKAFAGVHVFPGGNFDKAQDESVQMTAIRETFEEAGVLLASSSKSSTNVLSLELDTARKAIHSQKLPFASFLSQNNLEADTASLLPFTQWITPVGPPRRFHAHFFVTFLPTAPHTGAESGDHRHSLPTPDGGLEVVSARFVHPLDALAEFAQGKIALMPPQFYILTTLAPLLSTRVHTREQRQQVQRLSGSMFGRMVMNPRMLPPKEGEDRNGRAVLTYEGDEERGGKPGRLHRSLVRMGKGGVPSEVVLLRNFDILTEVDWSPPSAKL